MAPFKKKLVKKNISKRKRGRPAEPLLTPALVELMRRYILQNNPTMTLLCKTFGIESRNTLYRWMKENAEFGAVIQEAREISEKAWAEETRESLRKLTKGGRRKKTIREYDENGKMVAEKVTRESYLPDERACEFVLKNLEPERWRDKVEHDVGPQFGALVDRLNNALKRTANAGSGEKS